MDKVKKFFHAIDFLVLSPRLGRVRYIAMSAVWTMIFIGILALLELDLEKAKALSFSTIVKFDQFVLSLSVIVWILVSAFLMIRRLNDMDRCWWWLLFMLIPGAAYGFQMILMFWSGSKGSNDYGQEPTKPSAIYWVLIFLPLIVGAFFGSVSIVEWVKISTGVS